jgi:membrane protein implicated in regulation of membrane protease activity
MTLDLVYWIALATGLGILAISLVLGDIFDSFDVDIGDSGLPIIPVFFAAMAAFGAGGLLGTQAFGFGTGGSIASGIVTGLLGGLGAGALFLLLRRQEAGEGFEISQLVGERGRVTLGLGPGRVGKVAVRYAGMTRSLSATSQEDITTGEEVVVRDVIGTTITVARADRAERPG